MKDLHTFRLTLTLQGPILTQSSTPGAHGLDAVAARNAQGSFYLPGSLIKGRIREALHDLNQAKDATTWLGQADSVRSRLVFRDLVLQKGSSLLDGTLHRIQIEEETHAAKKGALVVIESPFAPGAEYAFHGDIELIEDAATVETARALVEHALGFVTSIGGLRGVGFGVLRSFSVSEPAVVTNTLSSVKARTGDLEVRIKPLYPFCLARTQPDGNLFSSTDEIPGGVIKGALAEALLRATGKELFELCRDADWAALATAFDSLAFSHAFPTVEKKQRPRRMPHSLVRVHGKTVDAAFVAEPFVARPTGTDEPWRAPAFLWDWKDVDADGARKDFEGSGPTWPALNRELRVRTAIDEGSRRAKEGALFAYEMVVPEDCDWVGRIAMPTAADAKLYEQLERAFQIAGLWGFGKTKSRADIHLSSSPTPPVTLQTGVVALTLQTDALLFSISDLDERHTTESTLGARYSAYFSALDRGLALVRYFASQRLVGGDYLQNQFMGGRYHPWMLTDAGSVFVLQATTQQAAEALSECLRLGLPALDRAQPTWDLCPYIRENGYGEIAAFVDPAVAHSIDLTTAPPFEIQGRNR